MKALDLFCRTWALKMNMQPKHYPPAFMPMASNGEPGYPGNLTGNGQVQPQPYLVMQPGSHSPVTMAMASTGHPGYLPNHTGNGQVQPQPYLVMQPGPSGQLIQPQVISIPSPNSTAPFPISARKGRALVCLGIAHVVLGALSFVSNGLGYYVHTTSRLLHQESGQGWL